MMNGDLPVRGPRAVRAGLALLAMLFAAPGAATPQSASRQSDPMESSILEMLRPGERTEEGIALGATVDPGRYYVGPSDVLSVNIWMSPAVEHRLEVTPEGSLIVPPVGEVPVAGILLPEAKKRILAAVAERYLGFRSTVTLVRPRAIIVSVRGEVVREGEYTVRATLIEPGILTPDASRFQVFALRGADDHPGQAAFRGSEQTDFRFEDVSNRVGNPLGFVKGGRPVARDVEEALVGVTPT